MESWLSAYDLDAIVCQNDGMAVARHAAGANSGIVITGLDGTPDGYEAIKDGRLYGTVDQDPGLYAEKTMELIVGYLHGDITELEDQYMLEFPIVTQENIDEYGPAGWD